MFISIKLSTYSPYIPISNITLSSTAQLQDVGPRDAAALQRHAAPSAARPRQGPGGALRAAAAGEAAGEAPTDAGLGSSMSLSWVVLLGWYIPNVSI